MGAPPFCGEGTPKHAAIMLAVFTMVGCILWLSWQTHQIIFLKDIIDGDDNPCTPNPCLHGGVCITSDKGDNRLNYVCDCLGTGFTGINCNFSEVRRISKKSCGEYYLEGHRADGYYYIDPDGPSSNALGPLRVRCEFKDGRAYTHLEHEYGGTRHLTQHYYNKYATATEYIVMEARYLEYLNFNPRELTDEQITLVKNYFDYVIDQSQHCEQTFSFRCKKWPLTTKGTGMSKNTQFYGGTPLLGKLLTLVAPVEGVTSAPGGDPNATDIPIQFPTESSGVTIPNVLPYDVGANGTFINALDMSGENFGVGEPKCACYLTDSCMDDATSSSSNSDIHEHNCHCDRNEDTYAEDVALFTKQKHRRYLPITSVFLATLFSNDMEAFAELSPLTCYEEFEVIDPFSKTRDGGYGRKKDEKYTNWQIEGFEIMWGCIIAFMVVTALLLLASFIFLMGIMLYNSGAVVFWLIMIVIMNIMVFIVLVIRWYYLGFEPVVWELAVMFVWMMITFYGMGAVVGFLDDVNAGRR